VFFTKGWEDDGGRVFFLRVVVVRLREDELGGCGLEFVRGTFAFAWDAHWWCFFDVMELKEIESIVLFDWQKQKLCFMKDRLYVPRCFQSNIQWWCYVDSEILMWHEVIMTEGGLSEFKCARLYLCLDKNGCIDLLLWQEGYDAFLEQEVM
jgi:hypothetical protein